MLFIGLPIPADVNAHARIWRLADILRARAFTPLTPCASVAGMSHFMQRPGASGRGCGRHRRRERRGRGRARALPRTRNFPVAELSLFASSRSAGKTLNFRGQAMQIAELGEHSFRGVDIALFSAGSASPRASRHLRPARRRVVIDNSSAFRMDADVPLVIPEINPRGGIARHQRHHRQSELRGDHLHHAALAHPSAQPRSAG